MTLAEALDRLHNAASCVVIALCLLVLWALLTFIEYAERNHPDPATWCRQHGKPRHECRDEHRE